MTAVAAVAAAQANQIKDGSEHFPTMGLGHTAKHPDTRSLGIFQGIPTLVSIALISFANDSLTHYHGSLSMKRD